MRRSEAKSCLAACLLTVIFIFLSTQPSLSQNSGLQAAAEAQATLTTPSGSKGELLYSDSFTARKESGWTVYSDANVTKSYKNGKYQVLLHRNDYSAWSFAGLSLRDFVVQVNATQESGPDDNDYGIVTRYADPGNFSLFLISGDGFFGYARKENNQWAVPVKWTRSDSINKGNAANLLEVVSRGSSLGFWVNGVRLGDFTDDDPRAGDIGLWVESFPEGGVSIGYDDLMVWEAEQ